MINWRSIRRFIARFWPGPSFYVSEAEAADLPALAEIHDASFPRSWDAEELHRMLDSPAMTGFVARREGGDGTPQGFLLLRVAADEAEIITIATAPSARGRGIGRLLMEEAGRRLHRDRAARLFLEVSENNAPALALYRSLGFRQVGRRQGYYASHLDGQGPAYGAGGEAAGKSAAARPAAPPAAPPLRLSCNSILVRPLPASGQARRKAAARANHRK